MALNDVAPQPMSEPLPSTVNLTTHVGDQIRSLMIEHRSVLLAQTLRLTGGDRTWAEDVVQETFIRAWRHNDRMTAEFGSVRAWLMRVAHNLVMDGYRARAARPVEVGDNDLDVEPVSDATDHVLITMIVNDALTGLADMHRTVLEKTYLQDMTMADTARELNLPLGTVKSRCFYALRQLREQIDGHLRQ